MLVDVVINGVSHDMPYTLADSYRTVVRAALDKSGHRDKAIEKFYMRRVDGTLIDAIDSVVDTEVVIVIWRS